MFGIVDFIIFFLTIFVSFCIGLFFAVWERNRNTTVDYFLAGRKSSTLPVALSFVVSFQSSLLVLGFPAEGYAYGVGIAYYAVGIFIAYSVAAVVIVPVFYPLKLLSVYEYFNLRYGNNILRYLTLAFGMVYTIFYMATVTVGTCVALQVVMGIPPWGTILLYTMVTAVYTSIGGIKAVIWTDVFQLIIMLAGMIAVLVKSTIDTGGSESVMKYAKERFDATDFRFDPTIRYQFWNVSVGTISAVLYMTLTQPAMQRVYCVSSAKQASILYFVATPFYILLTLIAVFEGPVLFGYFSGKGCDVLEAGIINNMNAIVPFAVLDLFRNQPGLAGLFTASLSSAAFSTLSSCLSSLSAVTYEDIIKVNFPQMKPLKATRISKTIVLLYGILSMVISFAILHIPGSISVIFNSFMGCMDGPLCAIFLMSLLCRRATTKGMSIGLILGCALVFWINVGGNFTKLDPYPYLPPGPTDQCHIYQNKLAVYPSTSNNDVFNTSITSQLATMTRGEVTTTTGTLRNPSSLQKFYSISYILYSLIGFLSTTFIGYAISLCTEKQADLDERCIFSFKKHVMDKFFVSKKNSGAHLQCDTATSEEESKFL
ncbi:sodium-coupled monocarboxylate transporter 2-like [Ruditapes philippinarum]|uniref:sodium-coupled monocarboxylate transporter 2-like n=1 Tax=Ruditapes philippinarum TaxID=129788 RepID=UPI00295B7121|nr:sodium-coupled monocarboxylate transporter 2-like [Ruditapes philippinarum]